MKEAYLAAGSFWEAQLSLDGIKGVLMTKVGYMGGFVPFPTYAQVLSGKTGHAQTVQVMYDEDVLSYEDLLNHFFAIHNPSTLNRQGPDCGTAFRSIVFYKTEEEKHQAERIKTLYNVLHHYKKIAVTQVCLADVFFEAEEIHQHFIEKYFKWWN